MDVTRSPFLYSPRKPFRALKAIFSWSVSEKGEVFTPETSCAKRTSVYIKNAWIKQLCKRHKLPGAKTFGTFKIRAPEANYPICTDLGLVAKTVKNLRRLEWNLILTKVSARFRKSTQVHTRPSKTESQVVASTCDSVWPGVYVNTFFSSNKFAWVLVTWVKSDSFRLEFQPLFGKISPHSSLPRTRCSFNASRQDMRKPDPRERWLPSLLCNSTP